MGFADYTNSLLRSTRKLKSSTLDHHFKNSDNLVVHGEVNKAYFSEQQIEQMEARAIEDWKERLAINRKKKFLSLLILIITLSFLVKGLLSIF